MDRSQMDAVQGTVKRMICKKMISVRKKDTCYALFKWHISTPLGVVGRGKPSEGASVWFFFKEIIF